MLKVILPTFKDNSAEIFVQQSWDFHPIQESNCPAGTRVSPSRVNSSFLICEWICFLSTFQCGLGKIRYCPFLVHKLAPQWWRHHQCWLFSNFAANLNFRRLQENFSPGKFSFAVLERILIKVSIQWEVTQKSLLQLFFKKQDGA